jgi:hypothetical protein
MLSMLPKKSSNKPQFDPPQEDSISSILLTKLKEAAIQLKFYCEPNWKETYKNEHATPHLEENNKKFWVDGETTGGYFYEAHLRPTFVPTGTHIFSMFWSGMVDDHGWNAIMICDFVSSQDLLSFEEGEVIIMIDFNQDLFCAHERQRGKFTKKCKLVENADFPYEFYIKMDSYSQKDLAAQIIPTHVCSLEYLFQKYPSSFKGQVQIYE